MKKETGERGGRALIEEEGRKSIQKERKESKITVRGVEKATRNHYYLPKHKYTCKFMCIHI